MQEDQQIDNGLLPPKKKINFKKLAIAFVFSVLVFTAGILVGDGSFSLQLNNGQQLDAVASDQPDDLSTDGIQEIYDLLKQKYDGEIDPKELLDGLKAGAVSAVGDTYTQYLSESETKDFNSDLNGTFEGIGAELSREGEFVIIIAPIKGTPADKAGIRPRDIIIEIDGESATGISVFDAVKRIRGEKDTEVVLVVIRDGKRVEVPIIRGIIDIASVEWRIEDGIGIIEVGRFGDDTTSLTRKAASEFKAAGVDKVILDLRGNPGGLLDEAVGMASIWLDKGTVVLEEKRGGKTVRTFNSTDIPILNGVKTIVMIDEGSASSSEILAGALRDNGAATLLGQKSFGKGSVQQLIALDSGGSLKVTIARWYTPNGKNIEKEGIEPDIKVKLTAENIENKEDPQLDEAKKLL